MALNIKNEEAEELARYLARRRSQSITKVLIVALRREVERERMALRPDDEQERLRRIDAIVARFNRRPVRDHRTADEILGYTDQGHFD